MIASRYRLFFFGVFFCSAHFRAISRSSALGPMASSFIDSRSVLLGFTRFYWVLPSFTGFDLV